MQSDSDDVHLRQHTSTTPTAAIAHPIALPGTNTVHRAGIAVGAGCNLLCGAIGMWASSTTISCSDIDHIHLRQHTSTTTTAAVAHPAALPGANTITRKTGVAVGAGLQPAVRSRWQLDSLTPQEMLVSSTTNTSGSTPAPPPQVPLQAPLSCQNPAQLGGGRSLFVHGVLLLVLPVVAAQASPAVLSRDTDHVSLRQHAKTTRTST